VAFADEEDKSKGYWQFRKFDAQYMDGLGRSLQSQIFQGSPDKTKDIITQTSLFDVFGRANKGISPTPSDGSTGAYKNNAESLASIFTVILLQVQKPFLNQVL
jgi:hypothetical protein